MARRDLETLRKHVKQQKQFERYLSRVLTIALVICLYFVITTNHQHIKNGFRVSLIKTYGFTEGTEITSDIWYIDIGRDIKDNDLEAFCVEALVKSGSTIQPHSSIVIADTNTLSVYKEIFGYNWKNASKALPKRCNDTFNLVDKSEPYWHKAKFGRGEFGRSIREIFGEAAVPLPRKKIDLSNYIDYYNNYEHR